VSEKSVWNQLRGLLSKPALRYHLLGFGLLAMSGYTILAFIGSIFTQSFDRVDLIPRYGWFLVATAVAVNGAGWISDRWAKYYGPRNRLAWGWISGIVSLPFLWVGLHSEQPMLAFWAIGIGNIIASSYNGVAAATIQFFARDDQRGIVGALYLFVVSVVGFGAGPPLAGWLSDQIFQGATAVASAVWTIYLLCGIGSSAAFYLARKHYEQDVV
jgi:MFS family permease